MVKPPHAQINAPSGPRKPKILTGASHYADFVNVIAEVTPATESQTYHGMVTAGGRGKVAVALIEPLSMLANRNYYSGRMQTGFIGLGNMGAAIAGNLLAA